MAKVTFRDSGHADLKMLMLRSCGLLLQGIGPFNVMEGDLEEDITEAYIYPFCDLKLRHTGQPV